MSSGGVPRWVRWALVLLLGSLVLGVGFGASSAGGAPAMGLCGASMAMNAPDSAGAPGMAVSGDAAVAHGQDARVDPGGADPGGRDCPAPVGLLGVCLGLMAVLVMVGQLLRPALAGVYIERAELGPDPGRARAVGRFTPRLAQLCVLRV